MTRLYWKIFGFLLLAQLTAIAITSAGFWWHRHQQNKESEGIEISRAVRVRVQSASATLAHGGEDALKDLLRQWQSKRRMPQVLAVDASGQDLLNRSVNPQLLATARALAERSRSNSVARITTPQGETLTLFVPEIDRSRRRGKIANAYKLKPRQPNLLPLRPIGASVIASFLFAALIAWYFSKPIKVLHRAFSKGAQGDLDSIVAAEMGNRKDAFADLGQDFDTMTNRLSKLLTGQKRMLNHVSHELRSPLSRMQIAIGLANQQPEKIAPSLERIQLESERMDQLIGELLELSKLDAGVSELKKETTDLSYLMQGIVENAEFEAAEKNITVESHIQADCQLNCDAELLYRAIENVVRNAIKYTHAQTTVAIQLTQQNQQATITVTDQGDGVDETALADIFLPFVRSNQAESKAGYGIGLALAKQVVEAHSGKIEAFNIPIKQGLAVKISLPI